MTAPPPKIDNEPIKVCTSLRYLGLEFDELLSFKNHIATATAKSRRMLGSVGSVLRRWHMSRTIETIWKTTICPAMAYGLPITHGHNKTDCEKLEKVNRLAARFVLNDYNCTHEQLLHRLKWTTISTQVNRERLRLMHDYNSTRRVAPVNWLHKPTGLRRSARIGRDNQFAVTGSQHWKTARTQSCGLLQMCRLWNNAPAELTSIEKRTLFIAATKKIHV